MNEIDKLHQAVEREYDSRHLASRTRYNALKNVIAFIKEYYHGDISCLEMDKTLFTSAFVGHTGYTSQASKSAINELFNQYHKMNNGMVHSKVAGTTERKVQEKKPTDAVPNIVLNSLPPVIDSASEVLILGTMPGPESLKTKQYYTSSHNSFWKIIAKVFNYGKSLNSYSEKMACLQKNHIALWDVYKSCNRVGAADSTIRNQVSNDIEALLLEFPSIKRIILNGSKAANNFRASVPYVQVCSSASYISFEQKVKEWEKWLII